MKDFRFHRVQFTLRRLFIFITAIGVCAAVFRITGWIETAGVTIAMCLATAAWALPQFRYYVAARGGLVCLALATLWMSAVDFSWFREGCPHCDSHYDVLEYRVFRQAVWSRSGEDHCPSIRLIADDLGVPCAHHYERWQKWRLWGLFYPAPCHNGICCMADLDWYVTADRARMRKMAADNPKLGPEFREQVFVKQNWTYLRRFIDDFNAPPVETGSK